MCVSITPRLRRLLLMLSSNHARRPRFHIRHALDPTMPGHGIPIDPATPGDDAAAHGLSPPRARKRRRRPRRVGAFARRTSTVVLTNEALEMGLVNRIKSLYGLLNLRVRRTVNG